VGARPVFVDCEPETGNITAELIAPAITSRTRAIGLVHFGGIACRMPEIVALAERHGLKVIEDCAIALGSRYDGTHVGLFGDAGCFSFYPVKHITTAEGGMFVSRHQAVTDAVARLRAFGVDRTHTERTIPGMYDVPSLGLNYRMSELQAALGRSQLRRMAKNLAIRAANFGALKAGLTGIAGLRIIDSEDPRRANSHYCMSVVIEGRLGASRTEIVRRLNAEGVGTSIYYPQPVPRMAYYRNKYGAVDGRFPRATAISDQSIALPVGPHLNTDDMAYIARTFSNILTELRHD
jgi:dTDP-4-amino-4,6-dideoxygalactose transaminase